MIGVIALCTVDPFLSNAWFVVVLAILACSWYGGIGPSLVAPIMLVMWTRIAQKEISDLFNFSARELTDLVVFLMLTVAVGWSGQARRRAQGVVQRQAAQLRDEARRKDRFLATLAHELRNPLAPLRTGLELLQVAGDEKPMVREVRELMQRQVDHLVRLVDDLLDLGRINAGKIELRRECVDLAVIIRNAVEASQPHIRDAQLQLDVAIVDAGLFVDADRARISQVLSNIMNNAAKFTPAGGHIQLSACRVEQTAEIRVRDDGIGIPSEMLPCVFDMFTQVDGSLERSRGGLGIGLSIVRTLVQMHGGTVAAHSNGAGHGSEFVIRLPLAAPASAEQERSLSSTAAQSGVARPRAILVADDKLVRDH
jgi:signal transduction histidine kinase